VRVGNVAAIASDRSAIGSLAATAGRLRRVLAVSLALFPATLGCDATLHALGAQNVNGPTSTHIGPMFEGRLHVPRKYYWVAGMEAGHLLQLEPRSVVDQWRLGLIGGLNELAHPVGSRFSAELTARIGLFRGSTGSTAPVAGGLYGGLAFALPFRISRTKEPWELDELLLTSCMLVPQIGFNALIPELRLPGTTAEATVSLALRMNLTSSVLP